MRTLFALCSIGLLACAGESAKGGDGGAPDDGAASTDQAGAPDDGLVPNEDQADPGDLAVDPSLPLATLLPAPPSYWYVDAAPFVIGVGGVGVTHYMYKLDTDTDWSAEQPIATGISRASVAPGRRTLEVRGRNDIGTWQSTPTTASFFMATVEHAAATIPCVKKTPTNGAICDLVVAATGDYQSFRTNEHPLPASCGGDDWGTQITNPGPGAVICLANGTHRGTVFSGLEGSAAAPITITNCGGQANFVGQSGDYGSLLKLNNSKYVRIVGTGTADPYGITLDASATAKDSTNSLEATCGATDYEIAFVEVKAASYSGIAARTNVSCDFNRSNFVQANTFIHHNKVHDTGGEGLYVGGSHWGYVPPSTAGGCDSTACKCGCDCAGEIRLESELHGVRIHHNLIEDTDADAIQVGSAFENNAIYANVVNRALQGDSGFNSGALSINSGTRGRVEGNIVTDSEFGAAIGGPGDILFANNIIVGPAVDARTCLQILGHNNLPGMGYHVINNTFVGCGNEGVFMYAVTSAGNIAANNFVFGATTPFQFNGPKANYDWTESNNITGANSLTTTYFMTAGNYCTLLPGTNAVDTGTDTSAYGVTHDYKGEARTGTYDVGACAAP